MAAGNDQVNTSDTGNCTGVTVSCHSNCINNLHDRPEESNEESNEEESITRTELFVHSNRPIMIGANPMFFVYLFC
jgi:hypothetical protein